jgi:hypothetical protein
MNGRQQLKVVPPRPGGQGNKLDVVADFFCEIFSFTKFAFGLEPKLFISSYRAVVFFPDFPGALSDFFFVGFCQSAGYLFQLHCQGQYALNRFPIAYPPREVAVLIGLPEKAGDRLLLIHRTLSIKLDDGDLNLFNGLEGLKLVLAPGTGGHICELFAEDPHWRKRLTELSRPYTDALDVAMERRGGTDD